MAVWIGSSPSAFVEVDGSDAPPLAIEDGDENDHGDDADEASVATTQPEQTPDDDSQPIVVGEVPGWESSQRATVDDVLVNGSHMNDAESHVVPNDSQDIDNRPVGHVELPPSPAAPNDGGNPVPSLEPAAGATGARGPGHDAALMPPPPPLSLAQREKRMEELKARMAEIQHLVKCDF